MIKEAKQALRRSFPRLMESLDTLRRRIGFRALYKELQRNTRAELYGKTPIVVLHGPFRGMRYLDVITWGSITPKWIGSYESELHTLVETIIGRRYDSVVNIGCAEGYYAVGLALRMPGVRVIACDADWISRRHVKALARLNNTAVEVRGPCDHSELQRLCIGRTLVISDIEGAEADLLDPITAPCLRQCDLLVEVHEGSGAAAGAGVDRKVELLLRSRFLGHSATIIAAEDDVTKNPYRAVVKDAVVLNEGRETGQHWLWLQSQTDTKER